MTCTRTRPLSPVTASAVLAGSLALGAAALGGGGDRPVFRLDIPSGMTTGRVVLHAETDDPRVASVVWTVDDLTRRAAPPGFEAEFYVGAVPHERPILAVALDDEKNALYQQSAILNPGERFLGVEIRSPFAGQKISGRIRVDIRVHVPADDALAALTLDSGDGPRDVPGDSPERTALVNVPDRATPLAVHLRTVSGRTAERTIVLNGRGILTTSEAHIVEQVVGVYRGSEPLEGLAAADFSVRDATGPCEIREVRLLRDLPLAVGLLVDTSQSLMHRDALKQATANRFVERTLREGDRVFLTRFGPAVVKVVGWTREKAPVRQAVLDLEDDVFAGTLLYDGVIRALYQFQGHQGARALLLISDGRPYEEVVEAASAIAYAKQSGVKIYALALPSTAEKTITKKEKDDEGKTIEKLEYVPVTEPPDLLTLGALANATGGRVYPVTKAEGLPRLYAEIERDLRTQYLVSYVPNAKRTGTFHRVEVNARRGRVQTSPGFFY
ncbi:MAG: VWA domain-containing protein [Thermoanaerobaculia bacterium]